MSDILITGGTGFIGQALLRSLLDDPISDSPQKIWILSREASKWSQGDDSVVAYVSDLKEIKNPNRLSAVINLAGESLAAKRWSEKQKQVIIDSRVTLTERVADWVRNNSLNLDVWINGSAIGWYGHQEPSTELSEESTAYPGFSHDLCDSWERAARSVEESTQRLAMIRIGIVLEAHGGPLEAMLPPFKLGLGGKMGSGKQIWSWIHLRDLIRLIREVLVNPSYSGVINATAPEPVSQGIFAKQLAKVLNRPSVMPMPGFVAKLVIGEFAEEVLLTGQKVLPRVALNRGFNFEYPTLPAALNAIFKGNESKTI